MSQSVHGHEVMEMMLEQEGQFSRASLKHAMAERFGVDARFHTCSASEMDGEALIDFLAARGKFIDSSDGFQTRADKISNHGCLSCERIMALAEFFALCYISPPLVSLFKA